ncbi:MAG: urea transporter [Bacteroidales bacterium]|nr:urea transporter [Bacteroidales bacterium]
MIYGKLRSAFPLFLQSVSNSYTQIFFAKHKIMGLLLMLVTLFDLYAGISGLIALVTANTAAYLAGLSRQQIINGLYGFNPLLVGLGLGVYYQPGLSFYVILVFISLLTLFMTVSLEGVMYKYGLPFLSIPFLIGIWIVSISTRQITNLEISERGIYTLNEMYSLGGLPLLRVYEWFNEISWPMPVKIYFRSLGAIFFQYHLFAGLIIAFGLVFWSRIAFVFSLIGFASAYMFYLLIGLQISEVSYSAIGFNFILTSIAIGAFFVVPSKYSLVWVMVSIPLLAFLTTAGSAVMWIFQLPVFSLPFNVVVILLLYVFRLRERYHGKPALVLVQQFSPEKNLYSSQINLNRMAHLARISIKLPFWGKWLVTQAIDGEHTHKSAWKYAWDFEMTDDEGKTYRGEGLQATDYYCFSKPVVSPADGTIAELEDGLEDNAIGDSNLRNNWGNSVVINHGGGLFSQLSHLKNNSIQVQKGQYVKAGEQLALCGNSGRSPYPHLHMQMQTSPEIGATTIDYPFASYVAFEDGQTSFHVSSQPRKQQTVFQNHPNELIDHAFHFIPGQELKWKYEGEQPAQGFSWTVETNIYNESCLVCSRTAAKAWFMKSPDIFMFTHFEGNRNSELYCFYLAAYQVITGVHPGLEVDEKITVAVYHHRGLKLLQDIVAPFYSFLAVHFRQWQSGMKQDLDGSRMLLRSVISYSAFGKIVKTNKFEILLSDNQLSEIHFFRNNLEVKLFRD